MPIDIHTTILVYDDGDVATANPQRRYVDWSRHVTGVAVTQPSVREYVAQPGELLSVFSGTRTTSIDDDTEFSISLNPVKPSVYRIEATTGTPGFRISRGLALNGQNISVSINNNSTAEFLITTAGTFSGVVAGDTVFIPHIATGDGVGSPFNPNNGGFWSVIGVSSKKLTLRRRVGESFVGAAEVVVLTDDNQLQAFGASGVQKNDNLEITDGFSVVTQKSFVVNEVTSNWVEFTSTESLPLESAVKPGASGMTFYSDSKRFVRVEVDQESVVRLNGDTGNTNRLSPRVSGDQKSVAHFEKWGPVWQLEILNRSSTSELTVTVISVE